MNVDSKGLIVAMLDRGAPQWGHHVAASGASRVHRAHSEIGSGRGSLTASTRPGYRFRRQSRPPIRNRSAPDSALVPSEIAPAPARMSAP